MLFYRLSPSIMICMIVALTTHFANAGGTVVAWGDSTYGQATPPSGLSNVVALAAGDYHSLALQSDGTVVAWGAESSDRTRVPPGLTNVVAIAVGTAHNLALRADGTVMGWGANHSGQSSIPPNVTNVVAVAAAGDVSAAVRFDGSVIVWGYWQRGRNPPPGLGNVQGVAIGQRFIGRCFLALRADGTVVTWGGDPNNRSDPPTGLSNVVAVVAGVSGNLALKADGTVTSWGEGSNGTNHVFSGLSNVVAISASNSQELALRSDGTVIARRFYNEPDLPEDLRNVAAVAAGGSHGLALVGAPAGVASPRLVGPRFLVCTVDRNFFCRLASLNGATSYGAHGLPAGLTLDPISGIITGKPLQTGKYSVVLSVTNVMGSADATITFWVNLPRPGVVTEVVPAYAGLQLFHPVITPNADLVTVNGIPAGLTYDSERGVILGIPQALGDYPVSVLASNRFGVATGTLAIRVTQIASWGEAGVPPQLGGVLAIAAGYANSLALRVDGTVGAWGSNESGQTNVPPGLSNVVSIASGYYQCLALREDGTVTAWSSKYYYATNVPASLSNVVAIAAGGGYSQGAFSLALLSDGTVARWGFDPFGQLAVPTDLSNVVAVAAGGSHALALRADGTVVVWGDSSYGKTNLPAGLTRVVAIAAGGHSSLALRSDGTVVAWGPNWYGEGNVPIGLSNVVAIAAGERHSVALLSDGHVVAWGDGMWGQTSVPTGVSNVAAVSGGGVHSLALIGGGPPLTDAWAESPSYGHSGFSLRISTQCGRVYALEYKDALTASNWVALPLVAGSGRRMSLRDSTVHTGSRFYRVRAW